MKTYIRLFCFVALSSITFIACKKDSDDYTTLRVKLTDAPAEYQEVNIDLKGITVKMNSDAEGWTELDPVPGIYNLLALQNGVDTLIATETLPKGSIKEIRLILGSDNTIKVDGVVYPLTIPSGSESGLKLKIDKKLTSDIETLIIDFDAALSIHTEGTGDYKLRPVLRIK